MNIQQIIKDILPVATIVSLGGGIGTGFLEISKNFYKPVETYYDVVSKYPNLMHRPIESINKYNIEMLQARKITVQAIMSNMKVYFLAAVVSLIVKKLIVHFSKENETKANVVSAFTFSGIALYLTNPINTIQALVSGSLYSLVKASDVQNDTLEDEFSIVSASLGAATLISVISFLDVWKINRMQRFINVFSS